MKNQLEHDHTSSTMRTLQVIKYHKYSILIEHPKIKHEPALSSPCMQYQAISQWDGSTSLQILYTAQDYIWGPFNLIITWNLDNQNM